MTKENILFVIIGILGGFMVGFFYANTVNQSAMAPTQPGVQQNAGMPSGHPAVPGANGGAIPEVQAAIDNARKNPTDFEAQMKAAELYYQIQRFDGAVEFLEKANELKPDDREVIVNLGNSYFDAGRYEDAEKTYSKALTKKPDDVNLRTDLGLTFLFRDPPNYDRATQEFKRVLEADANHVQALQNLTVAYTKTSEKASAAATLVRLEQVDPANTAIPKLREEIEKVASK